MSDIRQARKALARRILEGAGKASLSERRTAFNNSGLAEPLAALVDKVAGRAYKVSDEDVRAATASGFSEDRVFEIVVCAAIGQATRQYDAALAALEAAAGKESACGFESSIPAMVSVRRHFLRSFEPSRASRCSMSSSWSSTGPASTEDRCRQ